jgi:predicted ABC-type ATPase
MAAVLGVKKEARDAPQVQRDRGTPSVRTDGHFFFLTVPTVDLALTRVKGRVIEGGHDVPTSVVSRRFDRSMRNFFAYYRQLGDSWMVFDNSGATPVVVAFEKQGKLGIMDQGLYEALISRYGGP